MSSVASIQKDYFSIVHIIITLKGNENLLTYCFRDGDLYEALRDCHKAIQLDPSHSKAFFRQAKCLFELQWYEEATLCLMAFKERFPEQANSHSCKSLEVEIDRIMSKKTGMKSISISKSFPTVSYC